MSDRRIWRRFKAVRVLVRAWLRARRLGARLPPGRLDPSDRRMNRDQCYGLEAASACGPVFKAWWHGRYTTCVIGHARGRRLLAATEDRLVPGSIDLTALFAGGAIRAMQGETHAHYRRLLMRALQAVPLAAFEQEFRQLMRDGLATVAGEPSREALREALRSTAGAIMLRILFGVAPGSPPAVALAAQYRRFGPQAPAHAIGPEQGDAFAAIAGSVERLAAAIRGGEAAAPSMLYHLLFSGADDATARGNVIYLFEPAHFDLCSLWHWVVELIAGHPAVANRLAATIDAGDDNAAALARAVVLETLRLAQSEVLYRETMADVTFDGLLLPRGGIVRVGLWEGHKNPESFPEPFAFKPERFLGRDYPLDAYAPFGLDKHRCIGADLTVALTVQFVEELVRNFACTLIVPAPPRLGAFHWEPMSRLRLLPRPAEP